MKKFCCALTTNPAYRHVPAPARVTTHLVSISPAIGPLAGSQTVVMTGTGFADADAPLFGGSPSPFYSVDSDTQITARTPPGSGPVDVTVTTPGGSSTLAAGYVYTALVAPAAPIAVSPATGSTAGSTHVVIQVVDSSTLTSAEIDGVAVTGFAIVDPTHVSGDTVADTAGAKNVTVTNAAGTSPPLVGGYTYVAPFTPASLLPDGWWRDFALPWTPTAPGDAHGNLVASGTGPTAGTPVNGHVPAHFDGGAKALVSAMASSNFISNTAATLIVLFQPQGTLTPDQVAWYSEAPLVTTDGGDFGFSNSVSGVQGGDGAAHNTPYVPLPIGEWGMCAFRVSGTTGKVRVSRVSGTVDCTPSAGLTSLIIDSVLKMGTNWNGTVFQKGDFLEVLAFKRALSDAELDNVRGYLNTRYALALT